MEPRISLITLGVADMPRARRFYEALGWHAAGPSGDGINYAESAEKHYSSANSACPWRPLR